MSSIIATYGNDYADSVRVGDTLRLMADTPNDGNTWTGTVAIKTSLSASATDSLTLASYTGYPVRGSNWDLAYDYDTSSLTGNTKYLACFQLTSGSKRIESVQSFTVLPQGV